ncbi:MAG: hypothetical protein O3C59_09195, partial [Proteobacteria bacterium]|nr:hypothetical protein [Pseudomonadota bacterium]
LLELERLDRCNNEFHVLPLPVAVPVLSADTTNCGRHRLKTCSKRAGSNDHRAKLRNWKAKLHYFCAIWFR